MKYDSTTHHRKSIRLKGYDYSQAGLYFVTICCQNRACLFGDIINGEMILNDAGMMIDRIWNEIPNIHNEIDIDEFVIMPNHIHGIITVGTDSISAQKWEIPNRAEMDSPNRAEIPNRAEMDSAPTGVVTLGMVVQTFKRYSTIEYINMVKREFLPPFDKRIWQRNYWEHIIRNEDEYQRIAQYIMDNPKKWAMDKLNGGTGNQVMEPQTPYYDEAWMV